MHRGVYSAVAPELLTEDGHLIAALLAAGDGALLSHGTAAWRWRIIPAPPSVMQLAVPQPRTARAGVELHQSGRLRAGDITFNGRFRSTTPARTLLDLATRYDRRALLRALAEAEFQHDVRPDDIVRTLRRGHPGSANLRAALNEHAPGHGQMKSELERAFRRLLIRHRIELPAAQRARRPVDRRLPVAGAPRCRRARRAPARAPAPGRLRRRPRSVASPPRLRHAPLRQAPGRRAPRRRHRRPARRLRLGRGGRAAQAVVGVGQAADALVDLLGRDAGVGQAQGVAPAFEQEVRCPSRRSRRARRPRRRACRRRCPRAARPT